MDKEIQYTCLGLGGMRQQLITKNDLQKLLVVVSNIRQA
jgi:hypothetical protein